MSYRNDDFEPFDELKKPFDKARQKAKRKAKHRHRGNPKLLKVGPWKECVCPKHCEMADALDRYLGFNRYLGLDHPPHHGDTARVLLETCKCGATRFGEMEFARVQECLEMNRFVGFHCIHWGPWTGEEEVIE